MAKILDFFGRRQPAAPASVDASLTGLLDGVSIEVMPRTAAKIERFDEILPKGTRVYIAHIAGTPIEEMVETARRIAGEGFDVMPHFPARIIRDEAVLRDWIKRYQDAAGVTQGLILAGGVTEPEGRFESSMQLLDTGAFEDAGFTRLHVAGHPEGNRDIDPEGGEAEVMAALRWKEDYAARSKAEMAIATQFVFEAGPVEEWIARLQANGITLPVHLGVAGPAKLQTLIKFAMACGVGPSLRVLQRRAADVTKLLLPFTPEEVLQDLAAYKARTPDTLLERIHVFPLGGIKTSAEFVAAHGQKQPAARTATA